MSAEPPRLAALFARRTDGIRLGLEAVRAVYDGLGRPAAQVPALHIVGTNGKGSCAAMVAHALRAHGLRVGLYTSPHLVRVTERVRIDGIEVADGALWAAVDRVLALEDRAPRRLSFFEVLTLAAMVCFGEAPLDALVVEAGLGGRLDATRLVTARGVGITSIARDHERWLGDSLEAIAAEKAAVIGPGMTVVCAPQPPAVRRVVEHAASSADASLRMVAPLTEPPRGMPGGFQRDNGAVALELARVLVPAVSRGDLDGARWAARFEARPAGRGTLILDAAHNLAGAQALAAALRESDVGTVDAVVLAVMADKPREAMAAALAGCVRPGGTQVALSIAGADDPEVHRHVGRAIEAATSGACVLVCGSHVLVGAVRARLESPGGVTPHLDPTDPR